MLKNKIDFALIIQVKNANPNGDPLNGNRPRQTLDGLGEISDVCLKRKLRNVLLDSGENILVQSDDHTAKGDNFDNVRARFSQNANIAKLGKSAERSAIVEAACKEWFDVRAFGQVLAFTGEGNKAGVSIGIKAPVTVQSAYTVEPIVVEEKQITKSTTLEGKRGEKSSDTMAMKYSVGHGIYVAYGSISPQLAEGTGFSDADAEKIKNALVHILDGDESSARPAGSMRVLKVIWWKHKGASVNSMVTHGSLHVKNDGTYTLDKLDGVDIEELSA